MTSLRGILLGLALLSSAAWAQPARLEKQQLVASAAVKEQWRQHSFVPLTRSEFDPAMLKKYRFGPHQAPWAVIGDFNGDGKSDLLVDGHAGSKFQRVVFVSPAYRFLVVEEGDWVSTPGRRTANLEYVAPGKHDMPIGDQKPLQLKCDAYCEVYPEKAAILRYWKDGRFHDYYLAD